MQHYYAANWKSEKFPLFSTTREEALYGQFSWGHKKASPGDKIDMLVRVWAHSRAFRPKGLKSLEWAYIYVMKTLT